VTNIGAINRISTWCNFDFVFSDEYGAVGKWQKVLQMRRLAVGVGFSV
jgi:hypothetical protein